jgi:hypothetical protein
VIEEYITRDDARTTYGVVLDAANVIDAGATANLRAQRRTEGK